MIYKEYKCYECNSTFTDYDKKYKCSNCGSERIIEHTYDMQNDLRFNYDKNKDVGSGSWVVIIKSPNVAPACANPRRFDIYWAVPCNKNNKLGLGFDIYGRQAIIINTTEEVTLFTDEYTVLTDERLDEYRNNGYVMIEKNSKMNVPFNLELISKGRALTEEEREVIWALQLDGLNEQQACEEYFLTKHISYNNTNIMYIPNDMTRKDLVSTFGE